MNTLKMQWLRKLAQTKNYIIITDTESAIHIATHNPESFTDVQRLATQQMVLGQMRDRLDKVIVQYEKEIVKRTSIYTRSPKKNKSVKKVK